MRAPVASIDCFSAISVVVIVVWHCRSNRFRLMRLISLIASLRAWSVCPTRSTDSDAIWGTLGGTLCRVQCHVVSDGVSEILTPKGKGRLGVSNFQP